MRVPRGQIWNENLVIYLLYSKQSSAIHLCEDRKMPKNRWAVTSILSGFGAQSVSNKPSAPGFGFGSSFRDGASKLYSSREEDKARLKSQGGEDKLGPNAYKIPSTIGHPSSQSTIQSAPAVGFASSKRPDITPQDKTPGPGAYSKSFINKKGAPNTKFGTASRDQGSKVFISAEHDKVAEGEDSPGPGAYSASEALSLGREPKVSNKKRTPVASMGVGARFKPANVEL